MLRPVSGMSAPFEPAAKVLFRIPDDDGASEGETLWAFALGGDRYRIDNLPFFAYSVSLHDVVYAPLDASEGLPTFARIEAKSGNRTVRIAFDEPVAEGNGPQAVLDGLVRLGCDYEGANKRYISINIPPAVNLGHVGKYLIEAGVMWEHADPRYSDLFPEA